MVLTQTSILNGKICNLLVVLNVEWYKNWESMKGTSHWVSVTFE